MTDELEDLDIQRDKWLRLFELADTVSDAQKASTELRQVNARRAAVLELQEQERADQELANASDVAEIGEALLRALPEIARVNADLGCQIRDRLCEILPKR